MGSSGWPPAQRGGIRCTTGSRRSRVHEEGASHGVCWHRSAQEGKSDLPAYGDGRAPPLNSSPGRLTLVDRFSRMLTFPFGVLPELVTVLREQREWTREVEKRTGRIIPWVFHRDGAPIGKRGLRLAWLRTTKRSKLSGRIPHDFRRTAVRNLERAGVPRSVAMKLTGHKTESVYRRYAIVAEADLAEGLTKLAGLRERGEVVPLRPSGRA
jgi:Phage integrase family